MSRFFQSNNQEQAKQVQPSSTNRVLYFDVLRCAAMLAVIMIHMSAQNWRAADVHSAAWQAFNFWDSISRWSVPVFVMISGALFLRPDHPVTVKDLFHKHILHMITAFACWSVAYVIYDKLRHPEYTLLDQLPQLISGHFHLWFLLMIIGLYLLVPLLRPIAADTRLRRYYLIVSFIFTFAFTTMHLLAEELLPEAGTAPVVWRALNSAWNKADFHFTLGYVPYFVLGYELSCRPIEARERRWIYALSLAGFAITIIVSSAISLAHDAPYGLYDYLSVNVLFESMGVFVAARYHATACGERRRKMIQAISRDSFGVYLVHVMVRDLLEQAGLHTLSFLPVISVPVLTILVGVISMAVSALLHGIPGVRRYLV